MLTYPVHFPRDRYHGSNEAKRRKAADANRLIARVEAYVNDQGKLRSGPFHQYIYAMIAHELGLDPADVHRHCMVDGGSNGFTVIRSGLTMDQAFAEVGAEHDPAGKV